MGRPALPAHGGDAADGSGAPAGARPDARPALRTTRGSGLRPGARP